MDAEGVAHTVAVPDWRSVVEAEESVIGRLRRQDWSAAWVAEQQELIYEQVAAGVFGEGGRVGEPAAEPVKVTGQDVEGPQQAGAWLQRIDAWWRLDVLTALEDALDED
ncbi:hypothetical protein [Kineococcus xinjiangensis]|uniref:hypothetical protein n=1 Tax=Kineococcus xinjiangensis TaxID=512762 RepID=UPI0011B038FF|nr:hypothetical protein [Kineococcus xinjiangensis]